MDFYLEALDRQKKKENENPSVGMILCASKDDEVVEYAMGQTKQTFYETFTRTALRERSIPFIISAPVPKKDTSDDRKLEAFKRLEASRTKSVERMDHDKQTGTM